MKHRCWSGEQLAEILASDPGDARRAGVASCPRCSAHLAALAAFLAGDPALPAAETDAADRALAAFTHDLATRHPRASGARRGERSVSRSASRASRRGLAWPRLRWAGALAACAAVVAVAILAHESREPGHIGQRLRGGAAAGTDAALGPVTVRAATGGAVGLAWPAVPGADAYAVELFTVDLDTLALLAPVSEPAATLDRALLDDPRAARGILVKVRATRGGVTVAASRPEPLESN